MQFKSLKSPISGRRVRNRSSKRNGFIWTHTYEVCKIQVGLLVCMQLPDEENFDACTYRRNHGKYQPDAVDGVIRGHSERTWKDPKKAIAPVPNCTRETGPLPFMVFHERKNDCLNACSAKSWLTNYTS
jgi:hypothetical protein